MSPGNRAADMILKAYQEYVAERDPDLQEVPIEPQIDPPEEVFATYRDPPRKIRPVAPIRSTWVTRVRTAAKTLFRGE